MSSETITVRCRCPRGHVLFGVTMEGERVIGVEELVARMRESIAESRFGTACARCDAPRESWVIEIDPPLRAR
jgi:hypothetical protein